jgi:hypothetical protein
MSGRLELDGAAKATSASSRPEPEPNAGTHIDFVVVKQTEVEPAVGREPPPIASAALRLADRADESGHTAGGREPVIARLISGTARPPRDRRAERRLDARSRFDVRHVALNREGRAFAAALRINSVNCRCQSCSTVSASRSTTTS